MELSRTDTRVAKDEVFGLIGRNEPDYRRNGDRTDGTLAGAAPTKPTKSTSTAAAWLEVARYAYQDRDGSLLFEVIRYMMPEGNKTFAQVRPSGAEAAGTGCVEAGGIVKGLAAGKYVSDQAETRRSGKPAWRQAKEGEENSTKCVDFRKCPRVPYRLPELIGADPNEIVYLPEGEEDVKTLVSWGLVASCNPGGSGGVHLYADWTEYFRNRHIVILPDNDESGRKHGAAVAAAMLKVAASVRIVELPNLAAKGDVTDWRDAGGTFERFQELTDAAAVMDTGALSALGRTLGTGG
jgi:hypothetical protein